MKYVVSENRIKDIIFKHPLAYLETDFSRESLTHEDIAKKYQDCELRSIIVFSDLLHEDLYDNFRYCRVENYVVDCELISNAKNRISRNEVPGIEEVRALFNKYQLPLVKGNHHDDEEHYKFRCRLEEDYYDNLFLVEACEILKNLKELSKYDDDDFELDTITADANYKKELEEITIPRVQTLYNRVYDMPRPLDHWDSRNNFQQFFFVIDENSTKYVMGGYGSSGSRWNLGIMIHAFALLKDKVPTDIFEYNQFNELILRDSFPTFRCVHPHYGCNYHCDRKISEKLVEGICVERSTYIPEKPNESDNSNLGTSRCEYDGISSDGDPICE